MEKFKTIALYICAIIAFIGAMYLVIAGFIQGDNGEISGTVLMASGELITLFGVIFGLRTYENIQQEKIRMYRQQKQTED